MSSRRKPPDESQEPENEEQENDPAEEGEEEEEGEEGDDRPASADWFENLVAPRAPGVPTDAASAWQATQQVVDPTKMRVEVAEPLAVCTVDGASQWLVERRDPLNGSSDNMGTIPIDMTQPEFLKQFLPSMPMQNEDPVVFYLFPLDRAGNRLGNASKPNSIQKIPWDNPVLRRLRSAEVAKTAAASPAGQAASQSDALLALVREQLNEAREARLRAEAREQAAQERADRAREAALNERLAHSTTMTNDVTTAFTEVSKVQREGMTSLLTTQREADRMDREARREEERERRDRDAAERKAELDRVKAEGDARVAAIKEEAKLKLREAEIAAELRKEEIKAEVEKAKLASASETERIRAERVADEARRKDERDREDARREREDKRLAEHALSMEKMRSEAAERSEKRDDNERTRQREHLQLLVSTIEKRDATTASATAKPLGVVGDILDAFGMNPMDIVGLVKGAMAGGEAKGIGVSIVEGITALGKEVIKRLPSDEEGDDDEEDDEEGEEEEEEEEEQVQRPSKKPPRALPNADATVPVPNFDAFLPKTPEPVVPVLMLPDMPLPELRAGRGAIEKMLVAIDGIDSQQWGPKIMEAASGQPLFEFITKVGLDAALAEHEGVDVELTAKALDALGVFGGPVPRQPAPKE